MDGPLLYVVPLGAEQPDAAARVVIDAFVANGFVVVEHAGGVDEKAVHAQASSAGATAILLCSDEAQSLESFRPLVFRVRQSGPIFDVLVVGREREEVREGDWGAPSYIHPSQGEARLLWLAQFVRKGAGF